MKMYEKAGKIESKKGNPPNFKNVRDGVAVWVNEKDGEKYLTIEIDRLPLDMFMKGKLRLAAWKYTPKPQQGHLVDNLVHEELIG